MLNNLFSDENPLIRGLTMICDIAILSVIWLVSIIPVFTFGAATTALYYTVVKVFRRKKGYVFEEYKRSFKENFKEATILWLIFLLLFVLCGFNIYLSFGWITVMIGEQFGRLLMGIYMAVFLILFGTMLYMFPVLSRFVLSKTQLVKMSLALSFRHFLHTIVLFVLALISIVLGIHFFMTFPLLFLFAPGAFTLLISFVMEHVLKKYMPEDAWDDDKKTEQEIEYEEMLENESN